MLLIVCLTGNACTRSTILPKKDVPVAVEAVVAIPVEAVCAAVGAVTTERTTACELTISCCVCNLCAGRVTADAVFESFSF